MVESDREVTGLVPTMCKSVFGQYREPHNATGGLVSSFAWQQSRHKCVNATCTCKALCIKLPCGHMVN